MRIVEKSQTEIIVLKESSKKVFINNAQCLIFSNGGSKWNPAMAIVWGIQDLLDSFERMASLLHMFVLKFRFYSTRVTTRSRGFGLVCLICNHGARGIKFGTEKARAEEGGCGGVVQRNGWSFADANEDKEMRGSLMKSQ